MLAEALRKLLDETPPSVAPSAARQPMQAAEFVDALARIHASGWSFDLSGQLSGQLIRSSTSTPSPDDYAVVEELQERCPNLPREVAEIALSLLTGNEPDAAIVGEGADLSAKRAAVERFVMTDELRERFYLRHCGKVPRFTAIDWEVVVKEAERGHPRSPSFPYALATLDVINDVHGHHEHQGVTFAMGVHGLRRLISELSTLLECLEQSHASAKVRATRMMEDTDD